MNTSLRTAPIARCGGIVTAGARDDLVLLDPVTGACFGLNPTGAAVWRALERPLTYDLLIGLIASQFDGPRETIERDVLGLLDQLTEAGLITRAL